MGIFMYRLTILTDEALQPLGASVATVYDEERESILPVAVGPFDTLPEVLADLTTRVDVQQRLW